MVFRPTYNEGCSGLPAMTGLINLFKWDQSYEFQQNSTTTSFYSSRAADFTSTASHRMVNGNAVASYPFTFMGWFCPDAVNTTEYTIMSMGNTGGATAYYGVSFKNGDVLMQTSGNATETLTATCGISANTWHHMAAIWKNATYREIVVDGVSVQTSNTNIVINSAPNTTMIGALATSSPNTHFDGRIQQISIWNTAFTAAQVNSMYTANCGYNSYVANSSLTAEFPTANLMAWWQCHEANGKRIDESLNKWHMWRPAATNDPDSGYGRVLVPTQITHTSLRASGSNTVHLNVATNCLVSSWPMSFGLWYRSTAAVVGTDILLDFTDGTANTRVTFTSNGGVPRTTIFINGAGTQLDANCSRTDTDLDWHHALVTITNTKVTIYSDGVNCGANSSFATGVPTTTFTRLFQYGANGTFGFTGAIAEVTTWNVALTDADATALYAGGLGLLDDQSGYPNAASRTHYWPLSRFRPVGRARDQVGSAHFTEVGSISNDYGIPEAERRIGRVKTITSSTNRFSGMLIGPEIITSQPYLAYGPNSSITGLMFTGDAAQWVALNTNTFTMTQPFDIMVCCQCRNAADGNQQNILGGNAAANEMLIAKSTGNLRQINQGTARNGSAMTTDVEMWVARANTTDKLYINGGAADISDNAGTETHTGLYVGVGSGTGGNGYNGYVYSLNIARVASAKTTAAINKLGSKMAPIYGYTWTNMA